MEFPLGVQGAPSTPRGTAVSCRRVIRGLLACLGAAAAQASAADNRGTATQAAQLPAITVTAGQEEDHGPVRGYVAEESGIGTKTRTSILETPQSVSVVTREQIEMQQPASASQALRYVAGANSERYGGFGGQLDITRIRGIDADYYLDGLRVISNVSTWTPQIDPTRWNGSRCCAAHRRSCTGRAPAAWSTRSAGGRGRPRTRSSCRQAASGSARSVSTARGAQ